MASILQVENLTKKFGGLTALKEVSFNVKEGELLCVIGPNGAGKTTLFNIISGLDKPTSGTIIFQGKVIKGIPPHKINKLGIARTFQIPRPFVNLTVFQNLLVSTFYGAGLTGRDAEKNVEEMLNTIGLMEKMHLKANELTLIDLRKLELARALCSRPKLLLMDEVAAGLAHDEVPKLLNIVRRIHEKGMTLIIIEHVMSVVMELAERVLVLCEGVKLADGAIQEITRDKKVIEAYFGASYAYEGLRECA